MEGVQFELFVAVSGVRFDAIEQRAEHATFVHLHLDVDGQH